LTQCENSSDGYDIIGDIHGHADALERLLDQLGYELEDGSWQHRSRQAIFLGDFIDKGPQQKRVLEIVMPMVQEGHALAVMGNHEFNALAFHTPNGQGGWLRPHTKKNIEQHQAFLTEYQNPEELKPVLEFFWTLPLWIERQGLRVIHACWDEREFDTLKTERADQRLTLELLRKANIKGSKEYKAIELLLKGKELALPEGHEGFADNSNTRRFNIRVAWWDLNSTTYRKAYIGPERARGNIPDLSTGGRHRVPYEANETVLFLGHYWLTGDPQPLTANIACTDYSVTLEDGKLVAYRWSGEKELSKSNLVSVPGRL